MPWTAKTENPDASRYFGGECDNASGGERGSERLGGFVGSAGLPRGSIDAGPSMSRARNNTSVRGHSGCRSSPALGTVCSKRGDGSLRSPPERGKEALDKGGKKANTLRVSSLAERAFAETPGTTTRWGSAFFCSVDSSTPKSASRASANPPQWPQGERSSRRLPLTPSGIPQLPPRPWHHALSINIPRSPTPSTTPAVSNANSRLAARLDDR